MLIRLIEAADVASPWAAGRYEMETVDRYTEEKWKPDLAWCRERGIDYLPCVFPGFSWANMKRDSGLSDQISRHGGRFLWKQFTNLVGIGVQQVYVGMFDEIDEGTQILKVDNEPPVSGKDTFLSYYPHPEDHYLWITGLAQKLLRREIHLSEEFPKRQDDSRPEKK
ncbi:hypothetical protein G0Q06_03930 [Puniceicoccales bacterium CK1056]|uniref:Uncharacterized protein n=1 Tax=Oceanipulchritudo coccoides TaxID=2706888 RepID=A0A6B2LY86_9BACT|nr:hypothetical protein [Oceanipulchritudo coccoides]NDV61591.1 hypothetical protein [Oceanipulchritudo coccoides]